MDLNGYDNMADISYFDKLSPYGVSINGAYKIKSPKLIDISLAGYQRYQAALQILLSDEDDLLKAYSESQGIDYDLLKNMAKSIDHENIVFVLLTLEKAFRDSLINALSFFIENKIVWNEKSKCFLILNENEEIAVGIIDSKNYEIISDICLQLANISKRKPKALKFKNEAARKFYERFQAAKEKFNKNAKKDKNYEMANIIAVVATYHNSLNLSNIWELSVFQLYDAFAQLSKKRQIDIHETNYSVWGGENDPEEWIKRITSKEEEI